MQLLGLLSHCRQVFWGGVGCIVLVLSGQVPRGKRNFATPRRRVFGAWLRLANPQAWPLSKPAKAGWAQPESQIRKLSQQRTQLLLPDTAFSPPFQAVNVIRPRPGTTSDARQARPNVKLIKEKLIFF